MAYKAEILADSINRRAERLTTFEVTFPRMVLAEFNTHRMFSRNSASSRAIPVERQLRRVLDDPFVPVSWGVNQSGMQASAELSSEEAAAARTEWLRSRDWAVLGAVALIGGSRQLKDSALRQRIEQLKETAGYRGNDLTRSLHKQIANRLLEPFMWHTVIVTATDWSNYFALRANSQAQPEIQKIAYLMRDLYQTSQQQLLDQDDWHLPLIQDDEKDQTVENLKKMSVGRCARVSYLTHDTNSRDPEKDIRLHDSLLSSGHMSPFEHVARPMSDAETSQSAYGGNFRGWHQYRKDIANESDYSKVIDK